jgi:hypothetical protein
MNPFQNNMQIAAAQRRCSTMERRNDAYIPSRRLRNCPPGRPLGGAVIDDHRHRDFRPLQWRAAVICISTVWFIIVLIADMSIASSIAFIVASLFAVGGRT